RRALSRSWPDSVASTLVSRLVHRTLTAQVEVEISIVVLLGDRLFALGRDDAYDIDLHRRRTLLRHFRLLGPVARLSGGVLASPLPAALVPSVTRSLRLTSGSRRAGLAAIPMAPVATAADRRQGMAQPAVEQPGAVVLVAAARDRGPRRPAKNWTSPRRWAMTSQTATPCRRWALL